MRAPTGQIDLWPYETMLATACNVWQLCLMQPCLFKSTKASALDNTIVCAVTTT